MRFTAKTSNTIIQGFFLLCLMTQSLFSATIAITYQEDSTTNFKNPERGMRSDDGTNSTVGRIYYELGSYKNTDSLPQSVFTKVTNDCNSYRQAGRKLIPRFRYFSSGSSDAPLDRILKHIEQLGPVLKANSDVIALFEAGFIGCWGEWHHVTCGSSDVNRLDNTAARKAILFKEMECWPQDKYIIIRYNIIKRQIFETNVPLNADSGFSGSYRARTGAMNDCFRNDVSDAGTYDQPPYLETIEFQKTFLHEDNRYVPQEGESCGSSRYSVCDSAIKDLKRMHWDILAINSFTSQWSNGGCLNKILMNFGYRIALKSAQLPDSVRPNAYFVGTVKLINRGYGKMFNFRGCELVLKNTASVGNVVKVNLGIDPRRWCTTDSDTTIQIKGFIPTNTPQGSYRLYLNLPDTSSRLSTRKEYSVRLANVNLWDDATGYNSLQHTVVVSPNAPIVTMMTHDAAIKKLESVRVKMQNGSVEFTLPGTMPTPVTFEIFTLSGAKVWSRTVMPREDGVHTVKWTGGGSSSVFLWKVSTSDKGSSHSTTGAVRSLMVNRR